MDSKSGHKTIDASDHTKRPSLMEKVVREQHKKFGVYDKYEVIAELGKGSMGEVVVCTVKENAIGGSAVSPAKKKKLLSHLFRKSNRKKKQDEHEIEERREQPVCYALKSIRLDRFDEVMVKEIKNEVAILKSLDHPNIVKAFEVYFEKRNVYLILECCVGGNLYSKAPYSERAAAKISHDLLSAIGYMHERGIVHRDLKFENIMFGRDADDAIIKVIDFGLAKDLVGKKQKATMYSTVGTIYTMAPQVISGKYNSQADLWSIGVIIYMLVSQKLPFYNKNRRKFIDQIFKCDYKFDAKTSKNISSEAKDIINHLLVFNPSTRYDAEKAIKHEWFQKLNDGQLSDESKDIEIAHANTLMKYKQISELKKVALYLIAHRSTSDEIMEIRDIFTRYDKDANGTLSFDEFQEALQALGYPEDLVTEAFESIDINKNGEIMYTEFLAATLEARGHIEEERIAEAFDRIDKDDSGSIDRKELEFIMVDSCYEKGEIDTIFEEVDANHDGKISYTEFLTHFRKQSQKSSSMLFSEGDEDSDEDERYSGLMGPETDGIL